MAYGDITNEFVNGYVTRSRTGVETITSAVVLKDGSTKGSAAIDFTSNTLNLDQLTAIQAKNKAGIYVGTAGDLCVLLSGQSAPIATGTATTNTTNKLADTGATFTTINGGIQKRDIAVNLTDSTAAFVQVVDSATQLALADVSNSSSDAFPDGNEKYEIYRAVLFQNIAAGSLLHIEVDRVFALGTTASDIIAIY